LTAQKQFSISLFDVRYESTKLAGNALSAVDAIDDICDSNGAIDNTTSFE
jgi:hypothetical protein